MTAETYTGLSVTVATDGSQVAIDLACKLAASVGTDRTGVRIRRGTTTAAALVGEFFDVLGVSAIALSRKYGTRDSPPPGSVTYGVFVLLAGGSGNVTWSPTAAAPAVLEVRL